MSQKTKRPLVVVLGTGRVALCVARQLNRSGVNAMLVDGEQSEPPQPGSSVAEIRVHGNPLEPSAEIASLMRVADLVVAASGSDDTNALMAVIAERACDARSVIAVIGDPERISTFDRFGLTTIRPHELICAKIRDLLSDSLRIDDDRKTGDKR